MYAPTDPPHLERRLAPRRGNLAPPPGLDRRPGKQSTQSVNQFRWLFLSELVLHYTDSDLQILCAMQEEVDAKENQTVERAYWHAMSDGEHGQTSDQAKQLANKR